MEFLSANWVWLLLGLAVVWMLVSRRGRGCGFGGTRSGRSPHTAASAGDGENRHDHGAVNGDHEAGHALVAESRPHADRVAKISVIPQGVAALGYTQQQPTEDRYLMPRAELLDRLDVLLGGRVAEEPVFGDVSTGAPIPRDAHGEARGARVGGQAPDREGSCEQSGPRCAPGVRGGVPAVGSVMRER